MPELPEVETVRRGLLPHCKDKVIDQIIVRNDRLRWPIPKDISASIQGQSINSIDRRGKYLLFRLSKGTLILHLGMSGVLQVSDIDRPIKKHDHVDIILSDQTLIRYNDPRRFGAVLFTNDPIEMHSLISHLGPEPLSDSFNVSYIFKCTRQKQAPIKSWLMNAKNVVGVGNIYANEVLFLSQIHPLKKSNSLTQFECEALYKAIVIILEKAITAGGTTLKDFKNTAGKPGYFVQALNVYGNQNKPCVWCGTLLKAMMISKRQTVFCENCQPSND